MNNNNQVNGNSSISNNAAMLNVNVSKEDIMNTNILGLVKEAQREEVASYFVKQSGKRGNFPMSMKEYREGHHSDIDVVKGMSKEVDMLVVKKMDYKFIATNHTPELAVCFDIVANNTRLLDEQFNIEALFVTKFQPKVLAGSFETQKNTINIWAEAVCAGKKPVYFIDRAYDSSDIKKLGPNAWGIPLASGTYVDQEGQKIVWSLNFWYEGIDADYDIARISNYASQRICTSKEANEFMKMNLEQIDAKDVMVMTHLNHSYQEMKDGSFVRNVHLFNGERIHNKPTAKEVVMIQQIIEELVVKCDTKNVDLLGEKRIIEVTVSMTADEHNDGSSLAYFPQSDIVRMGLKSRTFKASGVGIAEDGHISAILKGTTIVLSANEMEKYVPGFDRSKAIMVSNSNLFKHISMKHQEGDVVSADIYLMNVGQNVHGGKTFTEKSCPNNVIFKNLVDNFAVRLSNGFMLVDKEYCISYTNIQFDHNHYVFDTKEEAHKYGLEIGIKPTQLEAATVQFKDGKFGLIYMLTNDSDILKIASKSEMEAAFVREPAYGNCVVMPVIETEAIQGIESYTALGYGVTFYLEAVDGDGDSGSVYVSTGLSIGYHTGSPLKGFSMKRIEEGVKYFETATEAEKVSYKNSLLEELVVFQTFNKFVVSTKEIGDDEQIHVSLQQLVMFFGSAKFVGMFTNALVRLNEGDFYAELAWLVEQPVQAIKHGANLIKFLLIIKQINEIQANFESEMEFGKSKDGRFYALNYNGLKYKYTNLMTETTPFEQKIGHIGHMRTLVERAIDGGKVKSWEMQDKLEANLGFSLNLDIAGIQTQETITKMIEAKYGDEPTKEQRLHFFITYFMRTLSNVLKDGDVKSWSTLFGLMMLTDIDTASYWNYCDAGCKLTTDFFNEILIKKADKQWKQLFHTIELSKMITKMIIDGEGISILDGGQDFSALSFERRMKVVSKLAKHFFKKHSLKAIEYATPEEKKQFMVQSFNQIVSLAGYIPPSVLGNAILDAQGYNTVDTLDSAKITFVD